MSGSLQGFTDGEVAVVTGGAGIIGRRLCAALADAGATVVVADIDADAAQATAEEIGERAIGLACDVSDPQSVEEFFAGIDKRFGRVDILLNNAATKTSDPRRIFTPFEQFDLATWREVMSVNIDGMFLMAQGAGRFMCRQKKGSIVQMASIYALVGPDARIYDGSDYLGGPINTPAVYSASKAAVIGFTRWLATYWAKEGVRVNCVVPGGVESGQNNTFVENYASRVPLGRMARADEMSGAVLYFASDASSYVTGQVLAVDGGWTAW